MSVNGLSTALGERTNPNFNSVTPPSELVNSATTKADSQVNTAQQDLTKPVDAKDKVTLTAQSSAKALADTADNLVTNKVDGEVPLSAEGSESEDATLLESLQKMTESTNQLAQMQNRKLEFSTSQESGRTIVRVIDKDSDDVIRQIPSEEFIRVAQKISDLSEQMNAAQGLLFESKV